MPSWTALLSSLLNMLVGTTLAAMVAAWVWLFVQLRQHKLVVSKPIVRAVPWGFPTVAAAGLSWFGLIAVVGLAYMKLTGRPRAEPFGFTEQMFVITVANGMALVVIPLLARLTSGATAQDLGLALSNAGKSFRVGVIAFLIVTWPVNLLNLVCIALVRTHQKHPLEEMVRGGLNGGIAYLAVLSAAVLAPAVEELLFRGLMQSWLEGLFRRRSEDGFVDSELDEAGELSVGRTLARNGVWAQWMPIVITSGVFAVAHATQWPAPIPIFILSLVLGSVYQRTGNLLASFVLHALFNGFSTLLLFWALLHGAGSDVKAIPPPQSTFAQRSAADAPIAGCSVPARAEQNRRGVHFFGLAHP